MRKVLPFLCLFGLTASSMAAPPGSAREGEHRLDWEAFLDRCREARVLYVGEEHTGTLDHQLQQEIIDGLARRGLKLTIVAEMFQWPQRQVLVDYVEGRINDEELLEQSEWKQRWGYPWELYLPIWQSCQRYHLNMLPLRNSSESGKLLGTRGLAAWSEEERQGLRPEPYDFGPNPEQLKSLFAAHGAPVSEESFQRFLRVQTLWEEFMAAQIRKGLQTEAEVVVVLVGKGHLIHGHGLPWRTQQGWPRSLEQKVVLLNPKESERGRASLEWVSPETPSAND